MIRVVEPEQRYLQRLAEIDAAVARARPGPDILLERAAGMLAGRVGCRISEAHQHLLLLAAEQDRDPGEVAAEVLAGLEAQLGGAGQLRAAVDEALHRPRPPARDRQPTRPPTPPVPADWAGVVQQVLDGLPGDHTALLPLRDEAGEVEDFLYVAVSPSVVDFSGRRGPEIVGLRVSEAYPHLHRGPIWEAWHATIREGEPRQLGPMPYVGGAERSPADVNLTVRMSPVGPGLVASWSRHDVQARLNERIAQTERLGSLGWGEADLVTGDIHWSDEMYRIFERDPADGPLPSSEQDALTLPEDEPIRRQAAESFGRGETADITYRLRFGDRIKHVRAVLDAVRDTQGRPLRVYGIVQDVTTRETSRARLVEVERQLREQQETLATEHRLAAQLQQIVLPIPDAPIDLPGIRVAVRYMPAEQASRVGGDWYHATEADDGTVLLAVGDVAGHGIHAATTMAQLRHTMTALSVTTTTDPANLLSHLNRLLYAAGPTASTATAVVARFDPRTRTLVWAQAGHPPPLLARAGVTMTLDRPPGPLLGATRDPVYGTAMTTLALDDLLLLYTDGLVEHRNHTLADGLAPVIETLNRISSERSPHPLLDLLAQLRRANPNDDTCILGARPLPREGR